MAKTGAFACPKCDRRFSMAAHLARHLSSHRPGGAKGRRTGRIRKALSAAGEVISDRMHGVIDALRAARDRIAEQREHLGSQFEAIGHALAALGGAPPAGAKARGPGNTQGGRRGQRAARGTVIVALLRTLNDKGPLKPTEAARLAGVKPTTTSTALDNLRKKRLAVRSGKGWSLTASGRAELAKRLKAGVES